MTMVIMTFIWEKFPLYHLDCFLPPMLEGMMLRLKLQYFGHLIAKSWLVGKDSDAGRDWGQEEKGMTEDEMAGWYHRLDGREFE